MKIAITGGTGFLGRHLSSHLLSLGHETIQIGRGDLTKEAAHVSKLIKSADVLINLAGSPVIKRWTRANRQVIWDSRVKTTDLLVEALLRLPDRDRPSIFISSSAIGIYDSVGVHSEQSTVFDDNFLAQLCVQWEKCLEPLSEIDIRKVIVRIGVVLGKEGGMLKKLIPIYRSGLGGKIGSGRQGFSFIHYRDFCSAIVFLIENHQCRGVFNLTAPGYTTNAQFSSVLARTCHRPAFLSVPEIALKLRYGQAAVTMLKGQQVYPGQLLEYGFRFDYPDITSALQEILAER